MDLTFLAAAQAASESVAPTLADAVTELTPIVEAAAPEAGPGEELDFSLWALFQKATITVQAVMVLLLLASFWSWAIIIEKAAKLSRVKRETDAFEEAFWSGQPLDQLYDRVSGRARSAIERVFVAGMSEWRRSFRREGGMIPGTAQRIDRAMNVAIARESAVITRRLSFLASVGSNAPFVGLFGTVWGIKTAFEAIAQEENTNLATVAPGIAEALLATALGLLAAIPAVIAYNRLAADAEAVGTTLENFADEFATVLSRQIDREQSLPGGMPPPQQGPMPGGML